MQGATAMCEAAGRMGQISDKLSKVDCYIESLQDRLTTLVTKLEPVSRGPEPSGGCDTACNAEQLVPVAARLESFAQRLNDLTEAVEIVIGRLEI